MLKYFTLNLARRSQALSSGILILNILFNTVLASDLAKEQRMREQVADYVMNGDTVLLKIKSGNFLSIYMESELQPAKGAIIILHGRGLHPNWPELVYPLRTGLPGYGWTTLSIQMPVLNNDASFYDYLNIMHEAHPRLNAAVTYLKEKNIKNIILLAHSCSVHAGFNWLHEHPAAGISAFIGIGMGTTDYGQPMKEPYALQDIKIPVLDIHGENDYPSVKDNAPRRLLRIQQAANPKSQQQIIPDANHYFTDKSALLLKQITNWLENL